MEEVAGQDPTGHRALPVWLAAARYMVLAVVDRAATTTPREVLAASRASAELVEMAAGGLRQAG